MRGYAYFFQGDKRFNFYSNEWRGALDVVVGDRQTHVHHRKDYRT